MASAMYGDIKRRDCGSVFIRWVGGRAGGRAGGWVGAGAGAGLGLGAPAACGSWCRVVQSVRKHFSLAGAS